MSLGKVSIIVDAAMAQFESDMGRASRIVEKEAKRWKAELKQYEDQARQAGKAVGVFIAAGVATASAAIKSAIDDMDALSKASVKVGLPTEEMSRLTYAGGLADVSMETLTSTLGKLTKSQAAAMSGTGEQAKMFEALGIKVTDASGKMRKSNEILYEFADRFAALKGSPEIMAAGFAIFGKSFQDMIPLIKDGSQAIRDAGEEARIFGLDVSTTAGQQAELFNDNLTRLKSAVLGLALQVATDLLPDLVKLTDNFVQLSKDGNGVSSTAARIADGLRVIAAMSGFVVTAFKLVGETIATVMAQAHAAVLFMTGDFQRAAALYADASAGWDKQVDDAFGGGPAKPPRVIMAGEEEEPIGFFKKSAGEIAAEKHAAELQARLQKALAVGGSGGKGREAGKAGKTDEQREAEALAKSYQSLIDQQNERIALFGKEGEEARMVYQTTLGSMANLTAAQKELLVTNAQRLDMMSAEKQVADDLARLDERRTKSAQQLLADLNDEIAMLGMSAEAQEIYNNLKWAGVTAEEALGRAIIETTEKLQQAREANRDVISAMDAVRSEGANFLTDWASGAKSFKDAAMDALGSLHRRLLQIVAENLMERLLGGFGTTGAGSPAGGFMSSIFGAMFGGGRAVGGSTQPGRFYEVNEQGPELYSAGGRTWLMAGDRGGHVTPLAEGGGAGRAPIQYFNTTIQGRMDRTTEEQFHRKQGRQAARGMSRTGGR
ncbi:hypothetical protein ARC78_15185 [Stenotrophomonas pictorum JCM 9942]|uniref:Bacteriophage tail tape measure C-terminal domain-containing protein n=1 Tax=Stenotrophomonas pictorum JCM 9942 TaxID=1236960 RepID=A0A0R0ABI9_9GAMM|nr:hypothetical protein [Stenotrophomonas pictorum]KRG38820.1 hypothetical protein ARC78_15185 [Stenotrophomonas pictorum JCM 9942]